MRDARGCPKLWILLGLWCAIPACKGNEPPARRVGDGAAPLPRVGPPDASIPEAAVAVAQGSDASACPGGLVCGGRCVDPRTDVAHCGACGRACLSTEVCVASACRSASQDAGALACAEGQVQCGPYCVTTGTDPLHCGRCGNRCARGQICARGLCAAGVPGTEGGAGVAGDAGAAACTEGQVRCGPYCATTGTDPLHCGRCGHRCAQGQLCTAGLCTTAGPGSQPAAPTRCAPPHVLCGAYCVATSADPLNCGGCGVRCAPGQVCAGGRCAESAARGDSGLAPARCAAPLVPCGAYCVNLTRDLFNCGACGVRCAEGQVCVGARCSAPGTGLDGGVGGLRPPPPAQCAAPQVSCGAYCALTTNDPFNCGRCGSRCAEGQVCAAGRCSAPGAGPVGGSPDATPPSAPSR